MPLPDAPHALVVGAGSAGLTLALLLAKAGRQVTLLEQQGAIGGYLRRFSRHGIRFDTGFHFTGGFDDVMPQILRVLELENDVTPSPLDSTIFLQETNRRLDLPSTGLHDLATFLADTFPADADAIRLYFQLEQAIVADTPLFNLHDTEQILAPQLSPYDSITLQEFFARQHFSSPEVPAILGVMAFCHGTPPADIPMAQHCRISCGLFRHLARVEHGGDAFLTGFQRELKRHGVTVRTHATIAKMLNFSSDNHCREVLLNQGDTLRTDEIFFAIHPDAYLPLFPDHLLTPSLRRRFAKFRDTCSFFSIYGRLDSALSPRPELLQFISRNDLNAVLAPGQEAYGTGMVTTVEDDAHGNRHNIFTAFRTMHLSELPAACGLDDPTRLPTRNHPRYLDFKRRMTDAILADAFRVYPHYADKLTLVDTASPLTFLRYSPPRGSAYGVQIRMAESRLAGRLPVRNCFALGHHAIMPGVLGSLLGAFLTFRLAVGENLYKSVIARA